MEKKIRLIQIDKHEHLSDDYCKDGSGKCCAVAIPEWMAVETRARKEALQSRPDVLAGEHIFLLSAVEW